MRRRPLASTLAILAFALVAATAPALTPAPEPAPEERLWQAAREGDLATLKSLIEAGVPVDAKTEFDCTALYFAANANQPEAMRLLLEAGATVDVRDSSYGFSAISMAGWLGHAEAVAVLLDGGVDSGDAVGAFFAAVGNGHAAAAKVFLEKLEIPQPQRDSALAMALRSGAADVAAALEAAGAKAPQSRPKEEGEEAAEVPAGAGPKDEIPAAPPPAADLDLERPIRVEAPANWPEFRGAGRRGAADGQHPPLAWDLESGRNVQWRSPVEGLGYSSPVVWGSRVFITTAISPETEQTFEDGGRGWIAAVEESVEHRWEVRAYDLASGELLWRRIAKTGVPRSQRHWKASQANPTCATDGKVVIAGFGSEGLYAYDLDGKPLWSRDLGVLNAGWYVDATFEWGYASSPILHDGRVYVQADTHGASFVAALDAGSGRELWRTYREEMPSWGTPTVHVGEERGELVLNASKAIVAYDAVDGKELWRIRGNSPITVASPLAQDGVIVATGGYREPKPIYVVKPGARGDLTPEEGKSPEGLYWSRQEGGVYIVTPLLYQGVLYLLRGNGVLTAYDPKSGEQHYRARVGGRYTASPVAADGRIYLTAEDGTVTVIAAGTELKVLAKSELGAPTLATPAISNGMLVFRTLHGLLGVGLRADAGGEEAPAP